MTIHTISDHNHILLRSKLHRQHLPHDLIVRVRLVEQLNSGVDRPVSLVCGPAGFGKTTLVCTWLDRLAASRPLSAPALPSAWLSLDEKDSDLNIFLSYFIAALRTIFPDACAETLTLLESLHQPLPEILYNTFSNDLEALPDEFILVLDDYQTIHGVEVHNLLSELVRHWPKPLHLVLISRTNPAIPIATLRARGLINEIRSKDLRFTPQETDDYLSQRHNVHLSQPTLHLLEERFEGWIVGLRLVFLSLRSLASQDAILSALSRENTNVANYFVNEVLISQFPAVLSFLLKSSILDRFCSSLCESVIGETDTAWNVRACLDWIERSELFIEPQDNHREWYRYHHLFQDFLKQRLAMEMAPEKVSELHCRASTWFEAHGMLDEALRHALAAGDLDLAARYMIEGLRDVINREDRPTLERWLQLLPDAMIQTNPGLLMIRAWVLQLTWRLDRQAQVIHKVEELLDSKMSASLPVEDFQILRGQILVLKSEHAYFNNQPLQSIDFSRQALALLPPSWTYVRGGAMLFLGMAMQAAGQGLAAEQMLLDEYEAYEYKTDTYALRLLLSLSFIYLNSGRLDKVSKISQLMIQGATHHRLAIIENWGDFFSGLELYQHNDLQAAAGYFTQIVENRSPVQISAYRDAIAGLALIQQARGESEEACQLLDRMSNYDLEQRADEDARTRSLRARLQLLQGNVDGAGQWADSFIGPPLDQPLIWLEEPQVTRIHVLVARGTNSDLQMAFQLLDTLDEMTERTHNIRWKIELLALRALALDALGATNEALAVLVQALDLARIGGFIRIFTDMGEPMHQLLRMLASQGDSVEDIHRILLSFPEDGNQAVTGELLRLPSASDPALAESLTPRELEILTLLREPLSNKGIAQKLNISYATVKRHTINLYGKLGVNQRWDAVARSIELDILPPE